MTTSTQHTFCRICEASCGLEVDVTQNTITDIRPIKDHIGTLGFSCMKGLNQHHMYASKDRLKFPLKKVNGEFEEISWAQANAEIGSTVKKLRQTSAQSIGMYVGTAAGFSLLHPIFAEGFMQGIGSHNIYSSATQDCANKFATAQAMYGFPFFQPFPDLDHLNCLLIVGTNPVVSKWTFLQVAHPVKRLKSIKQRGGRIIVVDPRRTETAKVAGEHIAISPNADVYFFLSFLNEIFNQNLAQTQAGVVGVESIRQLCEPWPASRTEAVTGITPATLKMAVTAFTSAYGAAIVTGTGVGMGKYGTLAHWLSEVINAITGNLDQKGGTLVGRGIFDFAEFSKKQGLFNRQAESRIGQFKELNGAFPGAILADEILTPGKEQIKALFVTGGNPVMTMANSGRLKDALEQLDMLVVTDIYLNETASLADYVLPATSPLERHDLPFVFPLFLGLQSIPYLAATKPVVSPEAEQKDEATIYTDLATASGTALFKSRFVQSLMRFAQWINEKRGGRGLPQQFILDSILRLSGAPRFAALLNHPKGFPTKPAQPGTFIGKRPLTEDHAVQLAPEELLAYANNLDQIFGSMTQEHRFRLITKRAHNTHNSWTQNIIELTHGPHNQTNRVFLHPGDAAKLKLEEGDAVDIRSDAATIRLPVALLEDLRQGVIAVPHGWGHQNAKGLSVAGKLAGANVNLLATDGPTICEPLSGMSHLTGIPVSLTKAAGPIDHKSWDGIQNQPIESLQQADDLQPPQIQLNP